MGHAAFCAAVLLGATALAGPTAAWADDMFNQTRSRTTPAGQEVVVGTHTRWNKRCQFDKMPVVTVLDPPHGGTVATRAGTKIAEGSVGSVTCNGREFPALLVFYQPNPGFHGQDRLRYRTDYGSSQTIATVTVYVE